MRIGVMSEITEEVEKAIENLGLVGQVCRVPEPEESQLYADLVSRFLGGKDRRWWWEGFMEPSASLVFADDMAFKRVAGFVPSAAEPCWFMVEDCAAAHFPIYDATPELASKIIGECFGFEYYLVAKDKRWLICENHHGRLIGLGSDVTQAMNGGNT